MVAAALWLLLYIVKRAKRSKYTPQWSTESSPAPLYTINSTTHPSSPPLPPPPQHRRPSHAPPPTGRRPSPSTVSLSSQLSEAYYTHSSTFSSLAPYIASQSTEQNRVTLPTMGSPSTSTSVILGFTPSEAAQRLSVRQAANQPPPAYPEVMEGDSRLPPELYTTSATGDGYGEVFGPSSDGLPSYETVVATRPPRVDSPPPYTPS